MDMLSGFGLVLAVVIGLAILVLLVVVHELGHAIFARRNGVVVEEFGIGFPPKAWSRKLKNGVLFSLNWLPLGGFVKLQGENDAADKKGDYGAASFWQKTKILLAGVGINWLVAAFLFMILSWFGLPKILPDQFYVAEDVRLTSGPVIVARVVADSPAEQAGLQNGDKIVKFNGQPLEKATSLSDKTKSNADSQVNLTYLRDGQEKIASPTLNNAKAAEAEGYLGVATAQRDFIHATWSAPIVGLGTTVQLTAFTFSALGDLVVDLGVGIFQSVQFNNQATQSAGEAKLDQVGASVAGPVGILGIIFPAAVEAGPTTLLMLTAIISLTLAVMNVLPIPGLDGGRWFLMAFYRVRGKTLTKEREEKIVGTGMLVLIGLIIVITIADIAKLGG